MKRFVRVILAIILIIVVFTAQSGEYGTFTDKRDGKMYQTVKIGGKTWMAQNLNYKTDNSWCYNNDNSKCNQYGRLYDWNTAKKVCPIGWHLPMREEWDILMWMVGSKKRDRYDDGKGLAFDYWDGAGTKLKSKTGWNLELGVPIGTDDYGFSALPGGYRGPTGRFDRVGNDGDWWTAMESSSDYAYYRHMDCHGDDVIEDIINRNDGFSVRCVAD